MRSSFLLAPLVFAAALNAQVTVVNGASFRGDQFLTQGSWAAAFGAFNGVTTGSANQSPLPTTVNGVTVTVDSIPAPIDYVSNLQINFVIPYGAHQGLDTVVVSAGGATYNGTVRVLDAAQPGIFLYNPTNLTPPIGAIINVDTNLVNSTTARATRGQYISVYGTGPGKLSANPADGAPASLTTLVTTTTNPTVWIAGVEVAAADVQFSGLAPGLVGVWQINVKVPDAPFVTGRVPLQIYMNGVDANEVSFFVN